MVLIIEDDDDTRAAYAEYLELLGFRVLTAATGAEAVAVAQGIVVDAVLLDWTLPDTHGPELYDRLRAIAAPRALPVVAVTGHALEAADRARFTAVMRKPVDLDTIAAWLRSVVPADESASGER